jgi:DNA-binding MarR family transcriptional regulator
VPPASFFASDYFAPSGVFITSNRNYVNMADITLKAPQRPGPAPGRFAGTRGAENHAPELRWDIIELLFFAYRDFVGDADIVLAEFGFGRAHHRVIHFVHRYPGLKVADLLDVLRITKQSLGRVLKQLVDEGYIAQKAGDSDKRQRLLFATAKGEALVAKLAGLQTDRINHALRELSASDAETVRRFLRNMIDLKEPDKVLQVIMGANRKDQP